MATSRTGTAAWKRIRRQVIREESFCHICGAEVDKTLPNTDPMHAAVDHLLPYALGGTDTRDNAALSHAQCNKSRGIKPIGSISADCRNYPHASRPWLDDYTECPNGHGWHYWTAA